MFSRSTIAVGAVLAALGLLAAVALASGGEATPTTAPAPSAETDPPVQVRTKVIRRTVHVRPQAAAASSSDDDGTLDQGPGDRPQIPLTSAPATASGDDHGRHDGDDDDFDDDNSGHGSSNSGHGGGDDDDGGDDDGGHGGHGGDDD